MHRVAVAGNPNVGKTSLFNALTGHRQKVGNWSGVTVEKKTGMMKIEGWDYELVDIPGIYSFSTHSLDEKVARDAILQKEEGLELIINILDASNLERNLYLTMQLIEMQVPMIVTLNMNDVAKEQSIKVDAQRLSKYLGMPVVKINAREKDGVDDLKKLVKQVLDNPQIPARQSYGEDLDSAIQELSTHYNAELDRVYHHPDWAALKLLEKDTEVLATIKNKELAQKKIKILETSLDEELDIILAEKRYELISKISLDCREKTSSTDKLSRSDKIDKVVLHRIWGIPVFLLIMWLMFKLAVDFGGGFIDFFDGFFGTIFVDGLGNLLGDGWLKIFLADGVGGGIQTVATFIPPIFMLFVGIGLLESSGYMARAAFVIDRVMRWVGLPGKAFVPMLMGFGCNAPAIMATRILEDENDRKLSIMMNPFMSCGARLPVYTLLAAAFFPSMTGTITFSVYIVGILMALFTGLSFKKFVIKKDSLTPFVMELPSYHAPQVGATLRLAWSKTIGFVKRAGWMVLLIVVLLQILGNIPVGVKQGEDFEAFSKKSLAGKIGVAMTTPLSPMGIQEENWPAAVGLFTGLFAKEAVIGTLESSYKAMAASESKEEKKADSFDFWGGITGAFASIPANLIGVINDKGEWEAGMLTKASFYVPFYEFIAGLSESEEFGEQSRLEKAFADKSISDASKRNSLAAAAAYAFMLFILLYVPCVAVLGAVYKELGAKWMWVQIGYQSVVAYTVSVLFYQISRLIII